jgi:amino acid adenylation domain-containing protein
MSTLPPNPSNIGSSCLAFLRRDPPANKSAAVGAFLRIPGVVAAYAVQSPRLPAVVAAKETLTYGELESQSNALARHLLSLGAAPETLVAVFLPRSPSAVVAALAIMKTGAAYLPLDPSCPSERIRLILEDARVPIVISDSSATSSLPDGPWQIVNVAEPHGTQRAHSAAPLPYAANPSQLAYVIYTSGSTGRPKGVEITHGNLSNLVRWHQSAFAVCPSDRATILASPGFDASVWEVWPYLTSGATLHLPSDTTRVSPRALRDWMLSNGITISFVPTPIAQRLLLLDWPAETPLRFLLTGADTLHQYPRAGLPFTLVNNYGPTECTVVTTSCTLTHRDRPSALPPIGRPIANTQVFVLDEHLLQVPQGSVGELHIAGAGVGRGYLNNPQLTQQKFIRNPFSSERGSRLYKTGDLVRPLPDGKLEFVGRADDQVKIRGYRVEPNEVSHALCKHDDIEAGIVVARKDRKGKHVLVAYVLPKPGFALNVVALRAHLQQHLPDYMIPSAFVLMHIFPLTTNGKVDRSALPPPNTSNTLPSGAARTAVAALESSTS